MNNNNNNNWPWIMAGVLFFIAMNNPQLWPLFFILLVVAASTWQNNVNTNRSSRRPTVRRGDQRPARSAGERRVTIGERSADVRARRSTDSIEAFPHAVKAAHAAGNYPKEGGVYPSDIGVLAYREGEEPMIVRDWEAPDDISYMQPYIELYVPRTASGNIRFEIFNTRGRLMYAREENRDLKAGRNLILPRTRLPLTASIDLEDGWHLRVLADGYLLADHTINFMEADQFNQSPLAAHIGEDGEISAQLQEALQDRDDSPLSIDDLLSDQDDDARQMRR